MRRDQAYRAYLFDLDGTLVDTAPDLLIALNHVLDQAGHQPASLALARHWVGYGARVMIEQAMKHRGGIEPNHERIERMFEAFIEHYNAHIAVHSETYPGVRNALDQLAQQGIPMGVVTNKMYKLSRHLLQQLGLYQYFGVLVGGDTMKVRKPNPEPVLHACSELNVSVDDTLMVGDSVTDVESARAAGCDVICVTYGYSHGIPPERLGADQTVDSFAELP